MGLVIFCHAGSDNGVPEVDDEPVGGRKYI